jgi:hypothetical protein
MKKKLLFLLCCAALLLCTTAGTAWASRDTYPSPGYPSHWYCVSIGGAVYWVDETSHTSGQVATNTVPAGSPVFVGETWLCCTYGQSIRQAKALLQRLDVWKADGTVVVSVDESTSRSYWTGPYDINMAYSHDFAPYNPKVQSGMWGNDWMIRIDPLTPGTYSFEYSDKLTHQIADPLFDPTPYHYLPYDWSSWGTNQFEVVEP